MRNWKAILGVVAIFILGMVAGGLIVGGMVARRIHRLHQGQPVFSADEVTRYLTRKLALDATQRTKVHAVVQEAQTEAGQIRKTGEAQLWGVISNAVTQLRPVLRPEQQAQLEQLVAERRVKRAD